MKEKEILQFADISLTYQADNGEVEALKNINFSIKEGELVSIVGPSGCGKTTLLSLIAGLEPPTSGKILISAEEVRGVSGKTGYMLQKDSLLDWRTIRGNVLLGLEIRGLKTAENIAYAEQLLKCYGLLDFRDKHPSQLSGGMRQRAALIRTLAVKPDILLLDEAFSALDYQTRLVVADDVYSILRNEKKTAIVVTHDIAEGISMADRIVILSKRPGRVSMDFPLEFGDAPPLKRRDNPSFRDYFNIIRKELGINV
ncbi:MAG: ABC transporter ATP-binding protein [Defluviitaleaceae bacterium]|nr:ABC transporter ATP-binding protein [Defluviitaleaceae bacterium]